MRLTNVYVRFYKSFNFDYERRARRDPHQDPWERLEDGSWYPFVRIEIEPDVTTVVGANESGKSHLLDAIEILITGAGISRGDFCRYSQFFSVERGKFRAPDFGGEFVVVSEGGAAALNASLKVEVGVGDRLHLFRLNGGSPVLYLPGADAPINLDETQQAALAPILPHVFRLKRDLALPDSVAISGLTGSGSLWGSRRKRQAFFTAVDPTWPTQEELKAKVPIIFKALAEVEAATTHVSSHEADQEQLARSLLFEIAHIDKKSFEELADAIGEEREGYVNGVIEKINEALARYLNFPRWWAQDREFSLRVSPREQELVFTIRDRTGTDYSFKERSSGLRYFLSYYIQLLAHPRESSRTHLLLMDEPDAFLSSQGQQDLLRILEEFARPEDQSRDDQVIYVTHSPFLINRNAASRIRVLDKGVGDEGTRVVGDAARNHYEPLRSSLGQFVAETAFVGGSNLFVEGLADQVLLAGMSAHQQAIGDASLQTLDLNKVTIVACGSASSDTGGCHRCLERMERMRSIERASRVSHSGEHE